MVFATLQRNRIKQDLHCSGFSLAKAQKYKGNGRFLTGDSDFCKKTKKGVDCGKGDLIMYQNFMGQQLRKRLKRQRRDARKKRVQARLRAGMKK